MLQKCVKLIKFAAPMKNLFRIHLPLLIVNIIYGINFTVAKSVMPKYIEPLAFIVLRVGVSLILFFFIQHFFIKEKIERKDLGKLLLCGIFGVYLNQSLFFIGIKYTTPIHGALIMIATPILVMISTRIIAKESVNWLKSVGIVCGAVGALLLIVGGKEIASGVNTLLGDSLVFINACCFAAYLVIVKPFMKKYHPITVVFWVFALGFLFVLPTGFFDLMKIDWNGFSPTTWWAVGSVVLVATFLVYILNNIALKHASAAVVGIYIYVQPIVAALVSIAFGKEQLNAIKIISAVLIFVGVFLVNRGATLLAKQKADVGEV